MQTIDGRPVYAATDLVGYLACEHLTQLERAALAGLVRRPMRDDPELDIIRKRGFEHEQRYLADLRRRRPDRRRRSRSTARSRTAASSCAQPPPSHDRGDGRRRRRHLPGDVLRRHVARATRTSCSGSTTRTAVDLGALALRGRGHEARPPRQGQRGPPDLQLCRPARADPGRPSGVDARRPGRQRPRGRAASRRRLHGLLPEREGALPGDDGRRGPRDVSAGGHVPRARRALRRLPLGRRMRRRGGGATIT